MIRVVLADDHPVVRAGTRTMLAQNEDIEIVGEAKNADEALQLVIATQPDVLLLDAVLPGKRTKRLMRTLHEQQPALRILILSAYKDADLVMGLLREGARGYLLKEESMNTIARAIRDVMDGKKIFSTDIIELLQQAALGDKETTDEKRAMATLTEREREVLALMVKGMNNAAIAKQLYISERTVKYHIGNIYGKLGVENRTEAVLLALKYPA
jgi:DNA-binding NarL/FixJ family response regulator